MLQFAKPGHQVMDIWQDSLRLGWCRCAVGQRVGHLVDVRSRNLVAFWRRFDEKMLSDGKLDKQTKLLVKQKIPSGGESGTEVGA